MNIIDHTPARRKCEMRSGICAIGIPIVKALTVIPAAANEHVVVPGDLLIDPEGPVVIRLGFLRQGRVIDISYKAWIFRTSQVLEYGLRNRVDPVERNDIQSCRV